MEPEKIKELFKTTPLVKQGEDKLMGTAYHEAGHALIDLKFGINPVGVSIIPDDMKRTAGHNELIWLAKGYYDIYDYILFEHGKDWSNDEVLEYHTCSLMGGIIAQAFYTGEYDWNGFTVDFDNIIGHFMSIGIDDIPSLQPFWDKTFSMIQENVGLLKRIATDLYTNKKLNEQYFNSLLYK